ncbi:PLCX1 protein, partial [Trogon melanurus]|nr:PLCX1 protein [Trogon melanurus]
GSHDTMTYCLDKRSVNGNESKLLKYLNKWLPCIVRPIIMKWSTTQELTVTEQLEAGVRYLDFRIAHKANDPSVNLYFVHMFYTTVTVQDTLWQILRWLETHPREVVILACRNFDGLTKKLHHHLVARIKEVFQSKLCPRYVSMRSFFPPFFKNNILRILLIPRGARSGVNAMLSSFCSPQRNTSCHLLIFVSGKFFVAGINLTENLIYILGHPFGSLKKITLQSLPCLKIWIKQQHPGSQKDCINIIAGDFIGNDDFVKYVIELNEKI